MHSTSINSTTSRNFMDYALEQEFSDIHCTIDAKTGMQAIIAIHNTNLGPALGGCRFVPYNNSDAAIYDAMRLARGMSYKSAIANLPLGGGKAVIIEPKHQYDRQAYMQHFGKFVESLNGRYVTALDSGTNLDDMGIISQHTAYVASNPHDNGNPAPSTAHVVFRGIQAAILFKLDRDSLSNIHVAIQGLGSVGYLLAKSLHEHGAKLSVADINPILVNQVVNEFGATAVDINDIHKIPCDVFAPCALGSIINDQSIHELQTTIIAGAANNQCSNDAIAQQLHENNILYAPDYVINSGGVIFAAHKYLKTPSEQIQQQFDQIYETLLNIFYTAAKTNQATNIIADKIAHQRLYGNKA
jgi:leucine dehydrogenase